MEPNTNKENLKKLLNFLRNQILAQPANRWFGAELYRLLAPNADAVLSEIHEQCVEAIIREQAEAFYRDFVIPSLCPQLIADFIKMEHWRRRNNFQEFCMAVYQQIECVVNYLVSDPLLCEVHRKMMYMKCYVVPPGKDRPVSVSLRSDKSDYTVAQLLFRDKVYERGQDELPNLTAFFKFKSVNYFVCHQACLTYYQFTQFREENNLFGSIYAVRNRNHRGNPPSDDEIKYTQDFDSNPGRAYLTVIAFLSSFMNNVDKGYPLSPKLIAFARTGFSC